ncbi:hypothetical protein QCA50_007521 [Cerrena zonata]|uniref:Uncharacterized protein n=1 Tax=Cerrena zonata TaxID=2478898 RepID=A0AAW0GB89_9APHY
MNVPSNQSFSKFNVHTPADTLVHYKSTKCCVIFDTKPVTWISADMPHRTRTTPCTKPWNLGPSSRRVGEAVVFEDVLAFLSQATSDENFTQSLGGLDF